MITADVVVRNNTLQQYAEDIQSTTTTPAGFSAGDESPGHRVIFDPTTIIHNCKSCSIIGHFGTSTTSFLGGFESQNEQGSSAVEPSASVAYCTDTGRAPTSVLTILFGVINCYFTFLFILINIIHDQVLGSFFHSLAIYLEQRLRYSISIQKQWPRSDDRIEIDRDSTSVMRSCNCT